MQLNDNQILQDLLDAYMERRQEILPQILEKTVHAKTPLVHQGEVSEYVYLVLRGSVRVHHDTPKGTEYLVALMGPGELIGEVEALTGEQATCSVTTIMESKIAVIPNAAYKLWLKDDHDFALIVNKIICRRLQNITRRSAINLSYPMEYSVLKLLKMMNSQSPSPHVGISKEEIANYLGTSVRSINRILKDLQSRGIISTTKGIEIISMEDLEHAMRAHDE